MVLLVFTNCVHTDSFTRLPSLHAHVLPADTLRPMKQDVAVMFAVSPLKILCHRWPELIPWLLLDLGIDHTPIAAD